MSAHTKRLQLVAVVASLGIMIGKTSVCDAQLQIPDASRKLLPILHYNVHFITNV